MALVERNVLAYRRIWYIFLTGFAEPLFFLLSIGIGVGELVGDIEVGGHIVAYDAVRRAGSARDRGDERRRCSTRRSTSS